MRRGLMQWDPAEVPQALLQSRVRTVAEECRRRGLDALLAFADFTRPCAVSALTHYVPFWSQAFLLLMPPGQTTLVAATTGRTVQWIRQTSQVDTVLRTGDIGTATAEHLREKLGEGPKRLGVVDLASMPAAAIGKLRRAHGQLELVAADDWFDALPGLQSPPMLAERALAIAGRGLQAAAALPAGFDGHALVAAVDGACRGAGAEEAFVHVAPDLQRDPRFLCLEGPSPLGERFALQISLAYKGHWLRVARTFERRPQAAAVVAAQTAEFLAQVGRGQSPSAVRAAVAALGAPLPQPSGAQLSDGQPGKQPPDTSSALPAPFWRVEGPRGALPLAFLDGSDAAQPQDRSRPGATLSLRIATRDGWWHAAQPYPLADAVGGAAQHS